MDTDTTSRIISEWYAAIGRGDMETVMNGLAENIEFELPQSDYSKIIPYLGTHVGRQAVAEAFRNRAETTTVEDYAVRDLIVQGNRACAVIYTKARCTLTNRPFEIEDIHRMELDEDGKIARWKVYFDPSPEAEAFRPYLNPRLIQAVQDGDVEAVQRLLELGADPNTRASRTGLTVLMMASAQGNVAIVKRLLDAGADPLTVDGTAGASVLHKACQGGSLEVARLLVEAGSFVDAAAATTGHTALMDAMWFAWPPLVEYLLDQGAGLNLSTHYGFSLRAHLDYEVRVNTLRPDQFRHIANLIQRREKSDQEKMQSHKLTAAVLANRLAAVRQLIQAGVGVDERFPLVNSINDDHTPLLIAAREGYTEIVAELVQAGADVNAVEPIFGAVPLHKAVYNGHAEIARILVDQPGINLDFQGATNGYTPLHDALWHGFADCGEILINAGARLDLKGHDGKTPLIIAREVFGHEHAILRLIEAKLQQ